MTSVVVLPFFFIVLCLAAIIDMNEAAKKAKGVKSEGLNLREVRSIKDAKGQKYEKVIIQQASVPAGPSNGQQQQQMACAEQQTHQQPQVVKLHKLKTIKAITEYELCKQECRRKKDMESAREYIDVLREELRLAEEQLQIQQQRELMEAAMASHAAAMAAENGTAVHETTGPAESAEAI